MALSSINKIQKDCKKFSKYSRKVNKKLRKHTRRLNKGFKTCEKFIENQRMDQGQEEDEEEPIHTVSNMRKLYQIKYGAENLEQLILESNAKKGNKCLLPDSEM